LWCFSAPVLSVPTIPGSHGGTRARGEALNHGSSLPEETSPMIYHGERSIQPGSIRSRAHSSFTTGVNRNRMNLYGIPVPGLSRPYVRSYCLYSIFQTLCPGYVYYRLCLLALSILYSVFLLPFPLPFKLQITSSADLP
jgi:hypothetical protein